MILDIGAKKITTVKTVVIFYITMIGSNICSRLIYPNPCVKVM